jgi:hypothetical protein
MVLPLVSMQKILLGFSARLECWTGRCVSVPDLTGLQLQVAPACLGPAGTSDGRRHRLVPATQGSLKCWGWLAPEAVVVRELLAWRNLPRRKDEDALCALHLDHACDAVRTARDKSSTAMQPVTLQFSHPFRWRHNVGSDRSRQPVTGVRVARPPTEPATKTRGGTCAKGDRRCITETNRISVVPFGMQMRTLGPYLAPAMLVGLPHLQLWFMNREMLPRFVASTTWSASRRKK